MDKEEKLIKQYIFPFVIFLLPLWNVWEGVDVVDTGYSLSNFLYFQELEGMWFFATYLSNFLGWIFTLLPGGETLLGMNIYTSLLIGSVALFAYYFLIKKASFVLVFLGEILAILLCWCPTVILYHYLTYILFTLGACTLCYGLYKHKNGMLVWAGILLGMNAFVRTPSNFLEVFLIVIVWYWGWIEKESGKEILHKTCFCVLGYFLSIILILGAMGLIYGLPIYFESIFQMLQSTKNATDYTFSVMVVTLFKNILEGGKWLCKLILFCIPTLLLQFIGKKEWVLRKLVLGVVWALVGIFLLMRLGFFDRNYQYHLAVYRPFLVFIWFTILFCLWQIFSKKSENWEKIWAMTVLVMTAILPFGTNNHLYANMNNLFIIAPFTLHTGMKIIRMGLEKKRNILRGAGGILIAFFAVFLIQSIGYGMNFILMDGYTQEKRDTLVEGVPALEGMYTRDENAYELENLYQYVQSRNQGKSMITFGNLPGLYFYFRIPSATFVLWPDLNTSSEVVFGEELDRVSQEIREGKESPLVIITHEIDVDIQNKNMNSEKEKKLYHYLVSNHYKKEYESGVYCVYVR